MQGDGMATDRMQDKPDRAFRRWCLIFILLCALSFANDTFFVLLCFWIGFGISARFRI